MRDVLKKLTTHDDDCSLMWGEQDDDKSCDCHVSEYGAEAAATIERLTAEHAAIVEHHPTAPHDGCECSSCEAQRAIRRMTATIERLSEDAMIAHRWFSQHFGEQLNGRDFAVKCPDATATIERLTADSKRLDYWFKSLEWDDPEGEPRRWRVFYDREGIDHAMKEAGDE